MKRAIVSCFGLWLAVSAAGCGDSLVDGNYRGERLFVLEGSVRVAPTTVESLKPIASSTDALLGAPSPQECAVQSAARVDTCAGVRETCAGSNALGAQTQSICQAVHAACLAPGSVGAPCESTPFAYLEPNPGCAALISACLADGVHLTRCTQLLSNCALSLQEARGTSPTPVGPSGELRLAMFWSRHALGSGEKLLAVDSLEQQAVVAATFPARYSLSLYQPPPPNALVDADGGGQYAIGLLLAYVDLDGDRIFSPNADRLVGGAPDRALLFTPEGAESVFFGSIEKGYHRVRIPRESGAPCESGVHTTLSLDPAAEFDLTIADHFHTAHLVDVNCDGHHGEWTVCADPGQLTGACLHPESHPDHAWQCSFCEVAPVQAYCPSPDQVAAGCAAQTLPAGICADCPTPGSPPEGCVAAHQDCLVSGTAPAQCNWDRVLCKGEAGLEAPLFDGALTACLALTDTAVALREDLLPVWFGDLASCLEVVAGRPSDLGALPCQEVLALCEVESSANACNVLRAVCEAK
jgi:hypothetical protein